MNITSDILKSILLDKKYISQDEYNLFEKSAKAQGISLYQYLLENNFIKDDQLGQLIANYFNYPYMNLSHIQIKDEIIKIIPEDFARKNNVIAFEQEGENLHIATPNPDDQEMISYLKRITNLKLFIHFSTINNIKEVLDLYAKDVVLAFEDILAENIKQTKNLYAKPQDMPIIKMVDTIIDYAYKNKASDVHIEPELDKSLLRFRIDGILHDIIQLPNNVHEQILTRMKVLSDLRTDTKHVPQDGKFKVKMYDENLNLRISTVPITQGEKVVLRLLSEKTRNLTLSDLGFKDESYNRIVEGYKKPYGMVLATGPTGSGKTTTLYAILKLLNKREVNVMTIEDPVEYEIEGVNQIQVNNKTGLNFETGLRSIVRQDPDIILVGEIRDTETAKIAVNSAMTGHLVLSSLHTNDAATALPRLIDLGIEPFLVASSTNVIVGQRLVRKICEQCRHSIDIDAEKIKYLSTVISPALIAKHFKKINRIYEGKGCEVCHGTGYSGRVGIYEVLEVDDEVKDAIVKRVSSSELNKIAVSKGMTTMIDDGLEKVKIGVTTIEEIIRVTKE